MSQVAAVLEFYTLLTLVSFPIVAVAFGFFYAKQKQQRFLYGLVVGLATLMVGGALAWFWRFGLSIAAALLTGYVADRKNRSRNLWVLLAIGFGPIPILIVLLLSFGQPAKHGLQLK